MPGRRGVSLSFLWKGEKYQTRKKILSAQMAMVLCVLRWWANGYSVILMSLSICLISNYFGPKWSITALYFKEKLEISQFVYKMYIQVVLYGFSIHVLKIDYFSNSGDFQGEYLYSHKLWMTFCEHYPYFLYFQGNLTSSSFMPSWLRSNKWNFAGRYLYSKRMNRAPLTKDFYQWKLWAQPCMVYPEPIVL